MKTMPKYKVGQFIIIDDIKSTKLTVCHIIEVLKIEDSKLNTIDSYTYFIELPFNETRFVQECEIKGYVTMVDKEQQ